jgi:hypothetical protein
MNIILICIAVIIVIMLIVTFLLLFNIKMIPTFFSFNNNCKTILGDVTQCFNTEINRKYGDEYFKDSYTHIEIKSSSKLKEILLRSYVIEFEYDPVDIKDVTKMMFSASTKRPSIFSNRRLEGRMIMTFHEKSRENKNINISMFMYPYIPSLKLSKIISEELDDTDAILNSEIGSFVKENHAYEIEI